MDTVNHNKETKKICVHCKKELKDSDSNALRNSFNVINHGYVCFGCWFNLED